jgi:cytochrome c-type biogenesis protein CcmH
MSWLVTFLLAAAVFCVLAFLLKAPRRGWEAIGTALLLGIAGYALQASPGLPGAPKPPQQTITGNPAALVDARQALSGKGQVSADNWVLVGDALARHGQYADAADVLLGAVEKDPHDGEAWLAMANALIAHADGTLTPAALFAYQHASAAAPSDPGPPFFLGMALAQSGRLADAKATWAELLRRAPKDAPWRSDLETRLARLDSLIEQQGGAQPAP